MNKEKGSPKQKILFELPESEHHDFSAETIWCEVLGENRYRLLNIPLYVYGASFGDIAIETDKETNFPIVEEVIERSGHSTYRVFVYESAVNNPEFDKYWKPVENLGCSFEGQTGNKMLGVDISLETDIFKVYKLLQEGENTEVWGFEEANCVHSTNN